MNASSCSQYTTNEACPVQGVLEVLQKLVPPWMVIHVGAGTGAGELHHWRNWSVASAIVLDADANRLKWTKYEAEGRSWHVASAVLDAEEREVEYFMASNPDESGLLAPKLLIGIWPNLHTQTRGQRQTRRLDKLLSETEYTANACRGPVWTLIDCFPAVRILEGAGEELLRWSVLGLRVLLVPQSDGLVDASLEAVTDFLTSRGFRCIAVSEGIHPAVGHAFFTQDWPAQLDTARNAHDEQQKLATERQAKIEALTKERDAQARFVDALQQQLIGTSGRLRQNYDQLNILKKKQSDMIAQNKTSREELLKIRAKLELIYELLQSETFVGLIHHQKGKSAFADIAIQHIRDVFLQIEQTDFDSKDYVCTRKTTYSPSIYQSKQPRIYIPQQPMEGIWYHRNDTFRELAFCWAELGFVQIQMTSDPFVWMYGIGEVLLYDRPNLSWLEEYAPHYELGLFGNPIPPDDKRSFPWIFWARHPKSIDRYIASNKSTFQRNYKCVFMGKYENEIQAANRIPFKDAEKICDIFSLVSRQEEYTYNQNEYLKNLSMSKYSILFAGFGSKCNRDIESMALGAVPIVYPGVDIFSYDEPLNENIHFFSVKNTDEARLILDSVDESQRAEMSLNCKNWYYRNSSIIGSFYKTIEIIHR